VIGSTSFPEPSAATTLRRHIDPVVVQMAGVGHGERDMLGELS
jgi:hypothetical protein